MLEIIALEVTTLAQKCRILIDGDGNRAAKQGVKPAVVVDPGGDIERIMAQIRECKVNVNAILITHIHIDHCGGVAALQAALQQEQGTVVPILGSHELDRKAKDLLELQAECFNIPLTGAFENTYLSDGQQLNLLPNYPLEVLLTPGHSPGSVCYYCPEAQLMLAGDLLTHGGIWTRKQPGSNLDHLMASLKRLKQYPDATKLLFGHGPDSTIGQEKECNPYLSKA